MNTQHIISQPSGPNDLTMVSINAIDSRVIGAKLDDSVVSYYAHTQAWTFNGGDALIVMGPNSSIVIFFRLGNRVARLTGYQGIAGVFENPPMWVAEALQAA